MEYKWTALTVTFLGSLMAGIDGRIVIVGLPTIARQLQAGAAQVIWVTQAYVLATVVGLLLVGRVSDLFWRVKMYTFGFAVFTASSLLCALSVNPLELIAFRLVQGVGVSLLVANSAAIVTDASPRNELGTMLGINQTAFRVGNVAGLTLSGVVLAFMDWRGLFYVNIPIGIFGTVWSYVKLKEMSTRDPAGSVDWPGFLSFSSSLTFVLLALTFFSFGSSGFIYGSIFSIIGFGLLPLFVLIEMKSRSPLLSLRLFRNRLFAASNLSQLLNSLTFGGMLVLLAFYLQLVLGYSPLKAGIAMLPLDLSYLITSLVSGKLSDKYTPRMLSTLGLVICTIGFFVMSGFTLSTQFAEFSLTLVVSGIGVGLFSSPNTKAIMSSVPPEKRGVASGFRETMWNVGLTASYGLIILLVTLGISYSDLSTLIQGSVTLLENSTLQLEFLNGFHIASLSIATISGIAIVPSVLRGKTEYYAQISRDVES